MTRYGEAQLNEQLRVPHLITDMYGFLLCRIDDLIKENDRLRLLALTDDLTGLFNPRYFFRHLEIEIGRARRTGHSVSLMMIDLDNLKAINDGMGHQEGNRALIEAAEVIRDNTRVTDIVCRYGGDEFSVIMPDTDVASALLIAGRLRHSLLRTALKSALPLTLSIGIAEAGANFSGRSEELVQAADGALYLAKRSGKNRTCTESTLPQASSV